METKDRILELLKKNKRASVEDLRKELGLSRQIIHRHLNDMQSAGVVDKVGSPPTVLYVVAENQAHADLTISKEKELFLDKNYLWVSASGEMYFGKEGFIRWASSIGHDSHLHSMVDEFIEIRKKANKHLASNGLIDATFKLKDVFAEVNLEKLYCLDFYALPKYGKTPIGQFVLYSKQAQQESLIKELANRAKEPLYGLIKSHKIDAVAFIPPTVKRNVQFLKVFEDRINLFLPKVELVKAYKGQIPIPQKTLSKLEHRVENARDSIYVKNVNTRFSKVLIIDDAVGSGASMNEVAKKLLEHGVAKKVYGFSLVGSYKGFDVISEV